MKKSVTILCLFFIILSATSMYAQTDFVKVIPLSRYNFKISNVSNFNFVVELDSRKYTISSGRMQPLKTKMLSTSSTMRVIYPKHEYNRVKNIVIREIAKYSALDLAREGVNSYLEEREKRNNADFSEILGRSIGNELLDFFIEQEIERLKEMLDVNEDLYYASNGGRNRYSSNFKEVFVYSYAKDGKIARRGLSPVVNFIWDFPVKKQDLGNFWDRKSSDFSSEIGLSVRLLPEIKWGNKNIFTSLNGFVSTYRPSYGLIAANRTFYVNGDYIAGGAPDLVELTTGENINLNLNQISGGLFIRNYFYPKFFLDLGAGYYFTNTSSLHFDPKGEDNNEVRHLPNSLSFDEKKQFDVAVVNQRELYGMARVGVYLTKIGISQPGHGFFLTGGCKLSYAPTFELGENHQLYYTDANTSSTISAERVPFVETMPSSNASEQKARFTWKLGFGVSL